MTNSKQMASEINLSVKLQRNNTIILCNKTLAKTFKMIIQMKKILFKKIKMKKTKDHPFLKRI